MTELYATLLFNGLMDLFIIVLTVYLLTENLNARKQIKELQK